MRTRSPIDVLRHTNAPPIEGVNDKHRHLSVKGVMQAYDLRRQISLSNQEAGLILCSPAPRSLMTAAIAYSMARPLVVELPELFTPDSEIGRILDDAFSKTGKDYGYDFKKYMADSTVWTALDEFAEDAAVAILANQRLAPVTRAPDIITVVATHAVYSNVIAYHIAECTEQAHGVCFGINMGEGDRLRVENGIVTHLPLVTKQ